MKRLPFLLVLTFIVISIIGSLGCGNDGDNDEEEIRGLLDQQIAGLNNVDLKPSYEQRTPGYRSRVSFEEFEAFLMAAFSSYLPMVESGEAQVAITDLAIDIESDWAYMTGKLGINGEVLLDYTESSPDIWHKIDGTWYNVETNPFFPGYDESELP